MKKIKLDLFSKSVENKIAAGEAIAPQMTADANADVAAAGAVLATATTGLNTKDTERTQKEADAVSATVGLLTQETVFDDAMRAASGKVMEKYPKDEEHWKDLGFEIGKEPVSAGIPAMVKNLSVSQGDISEQADLHWDPVTGTRIYNIEISVSKEAPLASAAPPAKAEWKPATPGLSTKSSVTVTSLTSGTFVSFRVSAVNAVGQGAPSNPVGRMIS